uniref:Haloacid dehalogenase like hydrolase domain containing 5 n=1 Tax=Myripristis murdjan TaxID=586833 RepID=A0A667YIG2_9TELE
LSLCLPVCLSLCLSVSQVGVLFDVDGVLVRGGSPIPAARRAFRKLLDSNNDFLLPVVFVTNAGNCLRQHKAAQLSHLLGVQIAPEQVMLSHSPLRLLRGFHDKCVLVSGQGPVTDIASSLGFHRVVSVEQLREQHPLLDRVDHSRRPTLTVPIILFGEPIRWETNLQLVIDVLLTDGNLTAPYHTTSSAHLPVLACNTDLMWMAEAPSPRCGPSRRFGHGVFLLCLEAVFRRLTGRELTYQAVLGKPSLLTYQHAEHLLRLQNNNSPVRTIYAIGDNLMTDIYGANLYNRHLAEQRVAMTTTTKLVAQGTGRTHTHTHTHVISLRLFQTSVLSVCPQVCTGVYSPGSLLPSDRSAEVQEAAFLPGQRDVLLEPGHVVQDVEAAVDLLLQQEGLNL